MRKTLLAAAFAVVAGSSPAQMMGGNSGAIATTAYFPLVDGAHYEYSFARGPWSSAMADVHGGQTWAGLPGLTAIHMTYTCLPGAACGPDATDFYRMDPDGMHYFGGTGAGYDGHHFSMMTYTTPEWPLRNPATPGTMMGGMYQNAGTWSTSVHGSHDMMGGEDHMSSYQALALETVTTPAGTFQNTLHVHEQRGSGYQRDVWYAPNVGIVMMQDATVTMQLSGYTIPGGVAQPGGGAAPLGFTPVTGMWWNADESGSGYNLQVQRGTLVMTMYTYDPAGTPLWYMGVATMHNAGTAVTAAGTLDRYAGGQCMSCGYQKPVVAGHDGNFSMTFTAADTCILQLPGGRMVTLHPMGW
ncbi:MAG: hypothetical protein U1F54_18105 [Burkholderiales bacterium]